MTVSTPAEHRSGFVALCGRPNVGKSTLVNALIGETIAVATEHPQTTRESLLAIWTEPGFQAVLVDTPGIHRARSALNRFMVSQARQATRDVDLVLVLAEAPAVLTADAALEWTPGEVALEVLQSVVGGTAPVALVLTKIDRVSDPAWLIPILEKWSQLHDFVGMIPTSAVASTGLAELRDIVVNALPLGPRYYDPENLSDRPLRWHAGELIRAELFAQLRQELPYSCAVQITQFEEGEGRDTVRATVFVERTSQKGMVIGRSAATIRAISQGARERISGLTGRPCNLRLEVAIAKNWTRDPLKLAEFGYKERPGR